VFRTLASADGILSNIVKQSCGCKNELMAISIPIYYIYNSESIYMDLEPPNLMGPLSTLSNQSTWCQVISKL